jgi:methylated-DNA-[protein]-cysteine S-methyltransferase
VTRLERAQVRTPVGALVVVARDELVCGTAFEDGEDEMLRLLGRRYDDVRVVRGAAGARRALEAYFGGEIGAIDTLGVELGGTPFQQKVWAALREIPAGSTWSYARLAAHVGAPYAVRAVGAANGRNPVGVIVPCHRVIASDGTLCGYGGGLHRKRWLLEHEGVHLPRESQSALPF